MQESQNREILHFSDVKDIGMSFGGSPCSYPEHWHLSAEFIVAVKNDCRYTIGNTKYSLNAGDILLIWPTELHSVLNTPSNASLILQFSSEIITGLKDIDQLSNQLKTCHLIKKDDSELYSHLFNKINECYTLYNSDELFVETRIKMLIIDMLLNIAKEVVTNRKAIANDNNSYRYHRVMEACEYISENCTRDLTQKEVAEYVNFSTYYFSRIFKEFTKESFSAYLTRQRLEHAVCLLANNEIPITDIAFLSGFQSISNFNKSFLKAKGASPKQYRKLCRNENP